MGKAKREIATRESMLLYRIDSTPVELNLPLSSAEGRNGSLIMDDI